MLGRQPKQLVEQLPFSTVSAKVAGIEQRRPVSFDQNRVRIEGGMIHKVRRDGERSEDNRPAVLKVNCILKFQPRRRKNVGSREDRLRPPPDQELGCFREAVRQSVVVLVRVGNDHAQERRIRFLKPLDRMQWKFVRIRHVEGKADVQHDPLALRLNFHAGSADFLGSSMNADFHAWLPPFALISASRANIALIWPQRIIPAKWPSLNRSLRTWVVKSFLRVSRSAVLSSSGFS